MSKNIAIIFAGGSGARMGSGMPKQFLEVGGKPIIIHTLDIFEEHDMIDKIYIACKEEYIKHLKRLIEKNLIRKVAGIVPGGTTGQDSIYKALKLAYEENDGDDIVLIHDLSPARRFLRRLSSVPTARPSRTCRQETNFSPHRRRSAFT